MLMWSCIGFKKMDKNEALLKLESMKNINELTSHFNNIRIRYGINDPEYIFYLKQAKKHPDIVPFSEDDFDVWYNTILELEKIVEKEEKEKEWMLNLEKLLKDCPLENFEISLNGKLYDASTYKKNDLELKNWWKERVKRTILEPKTYLVTLSIDGELYYYVGHHMPNTNYPKIIKETISVFCDNYLGSGKIVSNYIDNIIKQEIIGEFEDELSFIHQYAEKYRDKLLNITGNKYAIKKVSSLVESK
jgi:hypothetical protein